MTSLLRQLEKEYWNRNQLHALILELTHRCPCRCQHCYVVYNPQRDELTTEEICGLLDQARDEGVIQLMLTGGEVLLRQDLVEILTHARSHRFFVSLMTSGLTLDQEAADLLAAQRVTGVELSLLGATDQVNDSLMQHPGALIKIRRAAGLLRERGIGVVLKATIMRPNVGEIAAMIELARELDCAFNASPVVTQRRDGGKEPKQLELSEDDLALLEPSLLNGGLIPGEEGEGATLLCKAGRTFAGISPRGDVYPCTLWPRSVGNVRERALRDIWHDDPDPFLLQLRSLTTDDLAVCAGCALWSACRRCPGQAWQETGNMNGPAPSICAAARGHARARQLED